MATGPWPAFYADGRHLYIPHEDLPVILAYAKWKKIDFLVLEQRRIGTTANLAPLLLGKNNPPELSLVYEDDDKRGGGVLRIFRLREVGENKEGPDQGESANPAPTQNPCPPVSDVR